MKMCCLLSCVCDEIYLYHIVIAGLLNVDLMYALLICEYANMQFQEILVMYIYPLLHTIVVICLESQFDRFQKQYAHNML